jgi:hypothetical protein
VAGQRQYAVQDFAKQLVIIGAEDAERLLSMVGILQLRDHGKGISIL